MAEIVSSAKQGTALGEGSVYPQTARETAPGTKNSVGSQPFDFIAKHDKVFLAIPALLLGVVFALFRFGSPNVVQTVRFLTFHP